MTDLVVELYGVHVGALAGDWRTFDFVAARDAVGIFGIYSPNALHDQSHCWTRCWRFLTEFDAASRTDRESDPREVEPLLKEPCCGSL